MIRPGKFADAPRFARLMEEVHAKGPYAKLGCVDAKAAKTLFAQCVQRHGGTTDGSSLVYVSETNGEMEGFLIGMLDRVYHVGDMLMATDLYFIMSPRAYPLDCFALFEKFETWAHQNPKVVEIKLGTSFENGGDAQVLGKFYRSRGYNLNGEFYLKRIAR